MSETPPTLRSRRAPGRDTVGYAPGHAAAADMARRLGRELRLEALPLWGSPGSALVVAPARDVRRVDAAPVLALPRHAPARHLVAGQTVVCGVQDDDDVAAVAIAGLLAERLDMTLVLAHVVVPYAAAVPGPAAASIAVPPVVCDEARHHDELLRISQAAGTGRLEAVTTVLSGAPGPRLEHLGKAVDAFAVVVSQSVRPALMRALMGSATRHLLRRASRPVVVCPRDPRAAMRLRESTASAPRPLAP